MTFTIPPPSLTFITSTSTPNLHPPPDASPLAISQRGMSQRGNFLTPELLPLLDVLAQLLPRLLLSHTERMASALDRWRRKVTVRRARRASYAHLTTLAALYSLAVLNI